MRRITWIALVALLACKPRGAMPPPGTSDQTVAQAVALVCDAPARAEADRESTSSNKSDMIAKHLTDGIGNVDVLTTVEGWKTDGVKLKELDRLIKQAKLASCALRSNAR